MHARQSSWGTITLEVYDPINLALMLAAVPAEPVDFDHAADELRAQAFLPTRESFSVEHEDRFVTITVWHRSVLVEQDELTRELSVAVASAAKQRIYREEPSRERELVAV